MIKLPSDVRKAAEKIANENGMTVEAVVEHFRLAVKKNRFSRKDFLLPDSVITLQR